MYLALKAWFLWVANLEISPLSFKLVELVQHKDHKFRSSPVPSVISFAIDVEGRINLLSKVPKKSRDHFCSALPTGARFSNKIARVL